MEGHDLDDLDDIGALTQPEIESRIRWVSRQLVLCTQGLEDLPERIAETEAAYIKAYHQAHLESVTEHPDRRVAEHETVASLASVEELKAKRATIEEKRIKLATRDSYSTVLSALQSQLRAITAAISGR